MESEYIRLISELESAIDRARGLVAITESLVDELNAAANGIASKDDSLDHPWRLSIAAREAAKHTEDMIALALDRCQDMARG